MIPAFKPDAGPLPICCAVFVQIEHCANAISVVKSKVKKNKETTTHFFIITKVGT